MLWAVLGGRPAEELDFVEVGAVNAWRSSGPIVLWRRAQLAQPETGLAVLQGRPDLLVCSKPLAVEFAAESPRLHWVGVQVSKAEAGGHRIDEAALLELLGAVLPASSTDS